MTAARIGGWIACLLVSVLDVSATMVLPDGFAAKPVPGTYDLPVGLRFAADGTMFVVEKAGRVWSHNGTSKSIHPVIDLTAEVNNDLNRGALGFALHPGWVPDGGRTSFIYLLYTVSPMYGSDYGFNQDGRYSFSRLTRYRTHVDPVSGEPAAILGTRQILLGHQDASGRVQDGIASLHNSHATGDLHFAVDGTLLVLNGEGAHYDFLDSGGEDPAGFQDALLAPPPGESAPWYGPMPLYEDSGSFRAQDLRSLAGKVLRIDPETGSGLASNPYFTGDVHDNASKIWAGGLRNPYRSALKPGTGSIRPSDGDPGTLYVGDVGGSTWEEIDIVRGGENFGWPIFEGPATTSFASFIRSVNPLGWPDGRQLGRHVDPAAFRAPTVPAVAWHHAAPGQLTPPDLHRGFRGFASVGGEFYVGGSYPDFYDGTYFFADFGARWIRVLRTDANDDPVQILDFASNVNGLVDLERYPLTGEIFCVSISDGAVVRIRYGGMPCLSPSCTPTRPRAVFPRPERRRYR